MNRNLRNLAVMIPVVLGNMNYANAEPFEKVKNGGDIRFNQLAAQQDANISNGYGVNPISCPKLDLRMEELTRFSPISQLEDTLNLRRQTICKYSGEMPKGYLSLRIGLEDFPNKLDSPVKIDMSLNYDNKITVRGNYTGPSSGKIDNSVFFSANNWSKPNENGPIRVPKKVDTLLSQLNPVTQKGLRISYENGNSKCYQNQQLVTCPTDVKPKIQTADFRDGMLKIFKFN